LALRIAQQVGGEIVNFDSVQVYRGLDIGSAKTPFEKRAGVRHHLIDVSLPAEDLTAGAFAQLARICVKEIAVRGAVPLLVGGTGFYLRCLLEGLSPAPGRNPDLRQRLSELAVRRPAGLYRFLRRIDQAATTRIHRNDRQKLMRAIELAVANAPQIRPEPVPREPLTGFRILKIGLNPPRPDLYTRINQRAAVIFEQGLVEETRGLLDSGVPRGCKAMLGLGYRQAAAILEGKSSQAEALAELQTRTRQYAKRQMTWFRREKGVHWLPGFGDDPEIQRAGLALAASFVE
jgi:tRNA dimethylallyltransferase